MSDITRHHRSKDDKTVIGRNEEEGMTKEMMERRGARVDADGLEESS